MTLVLSPSAQRAFDRMCAEIHLCVLEEAALGLDDEATQEVVPVMELAESEIA